MVYSQVKQKQRGSCGEHHRLHKSNCSERRNTVEHLSHSLECIMAGGSVESFKLRALIKVVRGLNKGVNARWKRQGCLNERPRASVGMNNRLVESL